MSLALNATGAPAEALRYQTGFGNAFSSEALPGALPVGQNSPQRCPYGLYAEQLTGSAFTAPRSENRRTWFYRIRPAAVHAPYEPRTVPGWLGRFGADAPTPQQLRWSPLPRPTGAVDFLDGMQTMAVTGDPCAQAGMAVHRYVATASMQRRAFHNADGEMLILVQTGLHRFVTECGVLEAGPQHMVVIPRGMRFLVELPEGIGQGYVCENFGAAFRLPDLGMIGSNGPARAADFEIPVAAWQDESAPWDVVTKFGGGFWGAAQGHSPFDVVAWSGNHVPYRYDLRRYNAIGSISRDHPDPSIFLVMHSPSDTPGVSAIDFVIFPPRVLSMKDTFRPPWFHRNLASEFMGLLHGVYDAKAEGFAPGGASLHNAFTAHGPDAETFRKASHSDTTRPDDIRDTMAFMFESRTILRPTAAALADASLQANYHQCWQDLGRHFDPANPLAGVPQAR